MATSARASSRASESVAAQSGQQRAPSVGRGAPVLKTGGARQRPAQPEVGIGLVLGFFPGRAQQWIVVVRVGKPVRDGHGAFPQAFDLLEASS